MVCGWWVVAGAPKRMSRAVRRGVARRVVRVRLSILGYYSNFPLLVSVYWVSIEVWGRKSYDEFRGYAGGCGVRFGGVFAAEAWFSGFEDYACACATGGVVFVLGCWGCGGGWFSGGPRWWKTDCHECDL
jgi:hypothetical protein